MNREELEAKLDPLWYGTSNLSIGGGWYEIVSNLVDDLLELEPEVRILQIKEKFGALRVYITGYNNGLEEVILKAERASVFTCEMCGRAGTLGNQNGWYATRCKECSNVR